MMPLLSIVKTGTCSGRTVCAGPAAADEYSDDFFGREYLLMLKSSLANSRKMLIDPNSIEPEQLQ